MWCAHNNSPVGGYAEWLVAEKLGFVLEHNSKKGYDAYDPLTGLRYQIKSRWDRGAATTQSRELNVIRNYDDNQFDYLIIVVFDEHFGVKEAYMHPHKTIKSYPLQQAPEWLYLHCQRRCSDGRIHKRYYHITSIIVYF